MSEEIAQAAGDIAYWRKRAERAEARLLADNAAMTDLVRYVENSIDWDDQAFSLAAQRIHANITAVLAAEHPGAALRAELAAARAVVAAVVPIARYARLVLEQATARDTPQRDHNIVFMLNDVRVTIGDLRQIMQARAAYDTAVKAGDGT